MTNDTPRHRQTKPRNVRPAADIDDLLPMFDMGGSAYFGYRMALAAKLFDREIQRILKRDGNDLTLPQWRALSQLGLRNEASVRMLAEGAAVDRAEASRAVGELVKRGMVKRYENVADARSPLFRLTAVGIDMFRRLRHPIAAFIEQIVDETEDTDLLAANRVLRVVTTRCVLGARQSGEE